MTKLSSIDTMRPAASILVCLLVGLIGSLATRAKIPSWYASLHKPSFNPPSWLFAPAWTSLYILMGIALFLIWRKGLDTGGVKLALLVFFLQLVLNAIWSFAFFGAESPLAGLVVIIALWVAIAATIVLFAPLSRAAAVLLVPYILWVSFAAILNAAIYVLNR